LQALPPRHKKSLPPCEAKGRLGKNRTLVERILPGFGWLEANASAGLNLHGFASLWVTASASSALPHAPGTETCDGDLAVSFDAFLNRFQDHVYGLFSSSLGSLKLFTDSFDEFAFVHVRFGGERREWVF